MNKKHLEAFIECITKNKLLSEYEVKDNWIYDSIHKQYVGRVGEDMIQLIYGEYPNSSLTRDMFALREGIESFKLPYEEVVSAERMETWCSTVEAGKKHAIEHFRYIAKEFSDLADRVNNMKSIETPED